MVLARTGSIGWIAVATLTALLSLMGSARAQAAPPARLVIDAPLQQVTPITGTQHAGHNMPAGAPLQPSAVMTGTDHTGHNLPDAPAAQADAGAGISGMMARMADMQRMMARMQRMMASDMMNGNAMDGAMTMPEEMPRSMGEMMDMMGEMQEMMADLQGMMASEMGKGMRAESAPSMGQMQGLQMGGMMGPMPMMGTMIMVIPMMPGGMMQSMDMGKMMGEMPMMQGMNMGGMMAGQDDAPGNGPAAAAAQTANAAAAPQTGKLGEIEVKVTPPDLTNIQGETIDFTVDLNAAGADLSFDLAPLATLLIGDHKMPAEAWEVTLDHGHHVAGILKFPAHMQGAVEGATIVFTDPATSEELSLTWTTAE